MRACQSWSGRPAARGCQAGARARARTGGANAPIIPWMALALAGWLLIEIETSWH